MELFIGNKELLYPELSYELNGILFKVHNDLGRFCNEKQYGDAIEKILKEKEIPYHREYVIPQSFDGEMKGRNKVDFLIKGKIILEMKTKSHIERRDYFQIKRYLTAANLELGILVNFQCYHLVPKRVISRTK